jgi:hypothetical protein
VAPLWPPSGPPLTPLWAPSDPPPSLDVTRGGNDAGVDCVGDCTTGRHYCYAASGNLCASCVLHDPAPGEVLCSTFGHAMGGALPGSPEWAASCTNTSVPTSAASTYASTNLSCPVYVAHSVTSTVFRGGQSISYVDTLPLDLT